MDKSSRLAPAKVPRSGGATGGSTSRAPDTRRAPAIPPDFDPETDSESRRTREDSFSGPDFDPEATKCAGGRNRGWAKLEASDQVVIDEREIDEGESFEIDEDDLEELQDELIGTHLGSYRLLDLLGKGGMGKVYLAEHTKIGRKVAIKLLRQQYASRPEIVTRFFQEARAVNQIRHENIIDITDFVEEKGERAYLVMELLTGHDLGDLIRDCWPIELRRVFDIFVQIADGLAAAHDVGIVHRDLKPDNVFLSEKRGKSDVVRLVDFGVAKLLGDAMADFDGEMMVGTPAYMSPEQASGSSDVDHRADIYAFGAVLYRVCVGRPPFRGKTIEDYVRMHVEEPPVPPNQVPKIPEPIPERLEALILKCLEKDPGNRIQTMFEVAAEIRKLRDILFPIRQPKARIGLIALAAAVLLGGIGMAAFLIASGRMDSAVARPPNVVKEIVRVEVPVSDPSAVPAPAEPERTATKISFDSSPLGAGVWRADEPDGKPLGVTPFEAPFPIEDREVSFVFRLRGYGSATGAVSMLEDGKIALELDRTKTKTKRKPKPKAPATAAPKKKKKLDIYDRLTPF